MTVKQYLSSVNKIKAGKSAFLMKSAIGWKNMNFIEFFHLQMNITGLMSIIVILINPQGIESIENLKYEFTLKMNCWNLIFVSTFLLLIMF